jgi:hypothetical protein
MLGWIAGILFVIGWLIHVASISTSVVFSSTSFMLAGLACLAFHLVGVGVGWWTPRRRGGRR